MTQQKTILKLLDDEPTSHRTVGGSPWLPDTPPCPRSRSTPRGLTPKTPNSTPETPKDEMDMLIKRRKFPYSNKQQSLQKSEKLQRKVLKKALAGQAARSPLAERNVGPAARDSGRRSNSTKKKSSAFVKYRKYNSLDESFNSSFIGKENENIVWVD